VASAAVLPSLSLELFGNPFSSTSERLLQEALATPVLAAQRHFDVSFMAPVTK
jgi:hypothetical protein